MRREGVQNNKRGQIFPFLTVVLILMVVLVMAFVNTAQVNVRKVGTMNAADAGAMAGAAAIASAANAIADMNVNVIIPTYLADLAALSISGYYDAGTVSSTFIQYFEMAQAAIERYYAATTTGYKGVQQGGGAAISIAVQNMEIEQATYRTPNGMLTKQENLGPLGWSLSDALEAADVYTTDSHLNFFYEWPQHNYNITDDRQERQPPIPWPGANPLDPTSTGIPNVGFQERIEINVNKPRDNALQLDWLPVALAFPNWEAYVFPCLYVDACAACTASYLIAASGWVAQFIFWATSRVTLTALAMEATVVGFYTENYPMGGMQAVNTMASSVLGMYCIGHVPPCPTGGPAYGFCVLPYPAPMILNMRVSDDKLKVTARRFSPSRNLGLYQYQQQSIESSATARMNSGNSGSVFSPGSYKVEMVETN